MSLDCMPQGLIDPIDSTGLVSCPTAGHLLLSLGIFNLESTLLILVFGHNSIRKRIPSLTSSNSWRPWSALLTSIVHIIAVVIATFTLRSNGFQPDFEMLFGFWTMRPRANVAALIWAVFGAILSTDKSENPYLWSWRDAATQDTFLNIFAACFAAQYVANRPPSYEEGYCEGNYDLLTFWNTLYVIVVVGVVSVIVLFTYIFSRKVAGIIAGLNMMVSFIASWVVWGTFITNAGTDFCPGSILGQALAWGIAILLNTLLYPIVGGAQGS